LLYTNWI